MKYRNISKMNRPREWIKYRAKFWQEKPPVLMNNIFSDIMLLSFPFTYYDSISVKYSHLKIFQFDFYIHTGIFINVYKADVILNFIHVNAVQVYMCIRWKSNLIYHEYTTCIFATAE